MPGIDLEWSWQEDQRLCKKKSQVMSCLRGNLPTEILSSQGDVVVLVAEDHPLCDLAGKKIGDGGDHPRLGLLVGQHQEVDDGVL